MAENAKEFTTVREILTFARVTGGMSQDHERQAQKALDAIKQNRAWEVLRATNREREACARLVEAQTDPAIGKALAKSIRARPHPKEVS